MMHRTGRPRHYDVTPAVGYLNPEVAFTAAWLAELRERVLDQITDLTPEALNYVATGTRLSVARLVRHMAWGETEWMRRIGGPPPADDLAAVLGTDALSGFGADPVSAGSADELTTAVRRAAAEVAEPTLRGAADMDAVVFDDGTTLRGVLMHLLWHWTYHSGQVGLLQFEWGRDYEWTMHRPMAPSVSSPEL